MKVYKVKVNGKLFEVELESVSENNQTIADYSSCAIVQRNGKCPRFRS